MDIKIAFEKIRKYFIEEEEENKKSTSPKGETYFLLISINDYIKERSLNYCINESELLLNFWRDNPNQKIKSKNIYRLYNSNATKINILNNLRNLSHNISSHDQLIIHFAGHGYNKLESEFFVPFDGSYDNIYSCLSDVFINSYIKNLKASNVLFIVNTWKNNLDKESEDWQQLIETYLEKEFDKPIKKEKSIYKNLIQFLKVDNKQRTKEIFWFSRKAMNRSISEDIVLGDWIIRDAKLKKEINETRERIRQLLEKGNLEEALDQLNDIVENNDERINSQVKTLQYKLDSIKQDEITSKEIQAEKSQISTLSTGLINQIDNNGFYLINLPENEKGGSLKKKRTVILFTSADPSDQSRLRLNDEYRNIEYELMRSRNRDEYELIPCLASRIGDFQRKLLDIKPQIIHFSGHGENEGICLIGDDYGNTSIVENEPLAGLFRLFSNHIKCIFLNSCHSIHQSKLLCEHIDHIICMNSSVNDKTAIHFASSFYAALSSGENINFSFEFAKNSIDLHKLTGSDIPQLLLRKIE